MCWRDRARGSTGLRSDAAGALGALGDRPAADALAARLSDADEDVVIAASRALGALGDATCVPALLAPFRSERSSDTLKMTAAYALVRLGHREDGAGAHLAALLEQDEAHMRSALALLLAEWKPDLLGWDPALPAAEQEDAVARWKEFLLPA